MLDYRSISVCMYARTYAMTATRLHVQSRHHLKEITFNNTYILRHIYREYNTHCREKVNKIAIPTVCTLIIA